MGALTLSPWTWVIVLAVVALAAVAYLVWSVKSSKSTGATAVLSHPLFQRLAAHVAETAQATHHAALDAAIVKLLPAAAPFIPLVNTVADRVDAKIVGGSPPAVDSDTQLKRLESIVEDLLRGRKDS